MSTKAHFIYGQGIEGFEETSEPRTIFGKIKGFDVYLYIDKDRVNSIKIQGEYVILSVEPYKEMPSLFKIWGGVLLEFEYDKDGLFVKLEGGKVVTQNIINGNYDTNI